MDDIQIKDFQPINKWTVDNTSKDRFQDGEPEFIKDESTGRRYFNEPRETVGLKCFLLTFGTPFVHIPASLVNLAYRICKVFSLAHFWLPTCPIHGPFTLKARAIAAREDLLRIVMTPLAIIGLELSALWGLFTPYDGRKLYASIERAMYGNCVLAPCFQPEPTKHLLGGDPNKRGAW